MDTGVNGDRPLNRGEAPAHAGPSMMASRNRAETERINAENQKLLKRITQARVRRGERAARACAPHLRL
jgi:hypothetical protein